MESVAPGTGGELVAGAAAGRLSSPARRWSTASAAGSGSGWAAYHSRRRRAAATALTRPAPSRAADWAMASHAVHWAKSPPYGAPKRSVRMRAARSRAQGSVQREGKSSASVPTGAASTRSRRTRCSSRDTRGRKGLRGRPRQDARAEARVDARGSALGDLDDEVAGARGLGVERPGHLSAGGSGSRDPQGAGPRREDRWPPRPPLPEAPSQEGESRRADRPARLEGPGEGAARPRGPRTRSVHPGSAARAAEPRGVQRPRRAAPPAPREGPAVRAVPRPGPGLRGGPGDGAARAASPRRGGRRAGGAVGRGSTTRACRRCRSSIRWARG